MAQETLREFSSPSLENICTSPGHEGEEGNLEHPTKPSLINLVQVTQFSGKEHEDAKTLAEFLRDYKHNQSRRSQPRYHTVVSFHSHLKEEQRSGSTPTKKKSILGRTAQRLL